MVIILFTMSVTLGILVIAGLAPLWLIGLMIPFLSLIFYFSIRRGLKMLEENWASYQLLVGADSIVRKQVRLLDLEIHKDQITRLQETTGTGLVIRTQEKGLSILIPATIEGYDELRDRLSMVRY